MGDKDTNATEPVPSSAPPPPSRPPPPPMPEPAPLQQVERGDGEKYNSRQER